MMLLMNLAGRDPAGLRAAAIEIPPPTPNTVPLPPTPETPPAGPEPTPPEIEEPPLQPGEPIREPRTPPPMAGGAAVWIG